MSLRYRANIYILKIEPKLAFTMTWALLSYVLFIHRVVDIMSVCEELGVTAERTASMVYRLEYIKCVVVRCKGVSDFATYLADEGVFEELFLFLCQSVDRTCQEIHIVYELFFTKFAKTIECRLANLRTQGEAHQAKSMIAKKGRSIASHCKKMGQKLACIFCICASLQKMLRAFVHSIPNKWSKTIPTVWGE